MPLMNCDVSMLATNPEYSASGTSGKAAATSGRVEP